VKLCPTGSDAGRKGYVWLPAPICRNYARREAETRSLSPALPAP
jgi:hypothetical protein